MLRTDGPTHTQTDLKTVYPPQTKFAGGIKIFGTDRWIHIEQIGRTAEHRVVFVPTFRILNPFLDKYLSSEREIKCLPF